MNPDEIEINKLNETLNMSTEVPDVSGSDPHQQTADETYLALCIRQYEQLNGPVQTGAQFQKLLVAHE